MNLLRRRTIWVPTWQGWILLFLLVALGLVLLVANAHNFLAVTQRVENANILAVEAWVPEKVAEAAAQEYGKGNYLLLAITDLKGSDEPEGQAEGRRSAAAVRRMVSYGISRDHILVCVGAAAEEYRSFAMARALRDALHQRAISTHGVNIVAPAAHARKTWLAYSRALRSDTSVGIIAVLTGDYDPAHWWRSSQGAKWIIANGAGWLHELITGPRS